MEGELKNQENRSEDPNNGTGENLDKVDDVAVLNSTNNLLEEVVEETEDKSSVSEKGVENSTPIEENSNTKEENITEEVKREDKEIFESENGLEVEDFSTTKRSEEQSRGSEEVCDDQELNSNFSELEKDQKFEQSTMIMSKEIDQEISLTSNVQPENSPQALLEETAEEKQENSSPTRQQELKCKAQEQSNQVEENGEENLQKGGSVFGSGISYSNKTNFEEKPKQAKGAETRARKLATILQRDFELKHKDISEEEFPNNIPTENPISHPPQLTSTCEEPEIPRKHPMLKKIATEQNILVKKEALLPKAFSMPSISKSADTPGVLYRATPFTYLSSEALQRAKRENGTSEENTSISSESMTTVNLEEETKVVTTPPVAVKRTIGTKKEPENKKPEVGWREFCSCCWGRF